MSKKQLLSESQIRRFMTLANLEPLAKGVLSEMGGMAPPQDERRPETGMQEEMPAMGEEQPALPAGDEMGGETVEVGGDVEPEKKEAFEAAVKALADAMGIDVELESQEENAEEAGEEMHDLGGEEAGEESDEEEDEEESDEEEMDESKEEEMQEAKEQGEEEQQDESKTLSEDDLVETVLKRVTARLVAEAKKKKDSKESKVKQKMKMKKAEKAEKAEKKEKKMDEALDGVNLAEKGKEKLNVWKGHADMEMGKGEKGGKGGHEMETLTAKAEHTVTHGGKNLATMGGNKKK